MCLCCPRKTQEHLSKLQRQQQLSALHLPLNPTKIFISHDSWKKYLNIKEKSSFMWNMKAQWDQVGHAPNHTLTRNLHLECSQANTASFRPLGQLHSVCSSAWRRGELRTNHLHRPTDNPCMQFSAALRVKQREPHQPPFCHKDEQRPEEQHVSDFCIQ